MKPAAAFHQLVALGPGGGQAGGLLGDVGRQEVESALALPLREIIQAPVELVVADGAGVHAHHLEELVDDAALGDRGEGGALVVVAAGEQQGVRVGLLGVEDDRRELAQA